MKREHYLFVVLFLLPVLVSGCRTAPVSQKQLFFKRHPELKSRYTEFYETSLESIDQEIDTRVTEINILLRSLQEAYPNCGDLVERSNEVRKRWETGAAAEHEHVQLMRREFEPATDAMFFFRLIEGKSYGYGWVILRRGEIHKKFVLEGSGAIWGKKP